MSLIASLNVVNEPGTNLRKTANGFAITKFPITLPPAELSLMLRRNEDIVVVDVRGKGTP